MVEIIIIILVAIILILINKIIQQKKLIKRLQEFEYRWVNKYTDDEQDNKPIVGGKL
tara:strand:+ start:3328 stop:3498 length:171 start_codon:yes stop_codon:yes gene_type:complete